MLSASKTHTLYINLKKRFVNAKNSMNNMAFKESPRFATTPRQAWSKQTSEKTQNAANKPFTTSSDSKKK